MPNVYEAARAYRDRLDASEAALVEELRASYRPVRARLSRRAESTVEAIQQYVAMGERVPISLLVEERRLGALLVAMDAELSRWAAGQAPGVGRSVAEAVGLGPEAAAALVDAQSGALDRDLAARLVPFRPEEARQAIALAAPHGPVSELFAKIAPAATEAARTALMTAIVSGQSPLVLARELARVLDVPRWRAETIARSEMQRGFREAARARYKREGVATGWEWYSTLDRTTCAACWAMHGTVHPLDETMDTHPRCRCSMIPVVKPFILEPVKGGSPSAAQASARERFSNLPSSSRVKLIGRKGEAMYQQAGKGSLRQWQTPTRSGAWGGGRRRATLAEFSERTGVAVPRGPRPAPAPRPPPTKPRGTRVTKPKRPKKQKPTPEPTGAAAEQTAISKRIQQTWAQEAAFGNKTTAINRRVESARDALDAVGLRLPSTARLRARITKQGRASRRGFYRGGDQSIEVHADADSFGATGVGVEVTYWHEVGHWLDDFYLWGDTSHGVHGAAWRSKAAREFASEGDFGPTPEWEVFRQAVEDSKRIQAFDNRNDPDGYYRSLRECWARAFAQWMAGQQGSTPTYRWTNAQWSQWGPTEFTPIGKAVEGVLRSKGLLR